MQKSQAHKIRFRFCFKELVLEIGELELELGLELEDPIVGDGAKDDESDPSATKECSDAGIKLIEDDDDDPCRSNGAIGFRLAKDADAGSNISDGGRMDGIVDMIGGEPKDIRDARNDDSSNGTC